MPKKKKKKRVNFFRVLRLSLILVVVCAVGLGGYMLLGNSIPEQKEMQILFDAGTILPTTSINGVDVSNMTPAQARIAINDQVTQKASAISVKLQYTDRVDVLPSASIGIFPNADDTIRKAMLQGRQGGITQRKNTLASGTVQVLTLSYVYDEKTLEQNVRSAAAALNTAAIEPMVSVDENDQLIVSEGKDGIVLDVETFVTRVKAAVTSGTFGPVQMPGTPLKATLNTVEVKANTVKRSEFSTIFTDASTSGRAMNIKKMAAVLSGQAVLPGAEFSVNTLAGDRTIANGWYMAKGIENGVYTDQPGGGICQVSTTLYDAVLKADLQITERRPHSIPSHYVNRAFDATVNSGGPDFKFKNNTSYPIYVVIRIDESKGTGTGVNKKVIVEIWGQPLPNGQTIRLESRDTAHVPFDPMDVTYVTDPELVHGGRDYWVSELWQVYYDASGKKTGKEKRANVSSYARSKPALLVGTTPTPMPSVSPTATPKPSATPKPTATH